MTTVQQLVVGIFQERAQAEQAIDELVRAGFEHRQIHFAGPGPSIPAGGGGMLEKIKSLFTGQDVSAGWLYHDLENMGVSPEETRYYQSEFEAGRSLVAVQGSGGMEMASIILARHGGYGANQRFAQSANYGTAGAQQPGANYDPYDANQRVAQPPDYNEEANLRRPTPDYDAERANERVARSTDYDREADLRRPTPDYDADRANERVVRSTESGRDADLRKSTNEDVDAER